MKREKRKRKNDKRERESERRSLGYRVSSRAIAENSLLKTEPINRDQDIRNRM